MMLHFHFFTQQSYLTLTFLVHSKNQALKAFSAFRAEKAEQ